MKLFIIFLLLANLTWLFAASINDEARNVNKRAVCKAGRIVL